MVPKLSDAPSVSWLPPKQEAQPAFAQQPERLLEVQEREVIHRVPYQPLMKANVPVAKPPAVVWEAPPVLRNIPQRPASSLASPRHEPDEVQIHIGRIEVTAAPPTPPRMVPARRRASLDLGEYLKRSNRRTG